MDAHNVYLQLLAEVGILGFLIFIFIFLYSLIKTISLFRNIGNNEIHLTDDYHYYLSFSLAMQVYFLVYCLSGNPLYDAQVFYPYVVACAISYSIIRNNIKNKRRK
jgi:O-antigen ligase